MKTFDLPRCIIIYFFTETSTSVFLGIFYILWFGTLDRRPRDKGSFCILSRGVENTSYIEVRACIQSDGGA